MFLKCDLIFWIIKEKCREKGYLFELYKKDFKKMWGDLGLGRCVV